MSKHGASVRYLFILVAFAAILIGVGKWLYDDHPIRLCLVSERDSITRMHLENLLREHDIPSSWSSDGWLRLRRGHLRFAEALLRREAERLAPSFVAENHIDGEHLYVLSGDSTNQAQETYTNGIAFDERSEEPDECGMIVSAVVDAGLLELSETPILTAISWTKREYIGDNLNRGKGYEVEMKLVDDAADPQHSRVYCCQIVEGVAVNGWTKSSRRVESAGWDSLGSRLLDPHGGTERLRID